jgi:hypothetical protein
MRLHAFNQEAKIIDFSCCYYDYDGFIIHQVFIVKNHYNAALYSISQSLSLLTQLAGDQTDLVVETEGHQTKKQN